MQRFVASRNSSHLLRLASKPRHSSTTAAAAKTSTTVAKRDFEYFENFEMADGGVAIVRLNGPNKMNTISAGMQAEAQAIFREKILGNKDVKAVVFISSKSDNFIAGADIDMIKTVKNKADLQAMTMKVCRLYHIRKSF